MTAIALGLGLGALLGAAHLLSLRANAQYYVVSGSWAKAALLYGLRLAVIGTAFWLIARVGAAVLIVTLIGFLVMRSVFLARFVFRHG